MKLRPLGRSGLSIAPLMFGGNVFGWTADESTSFALLDAFTDAGFNAVDTADSYSRWVAGHKGGESETVIGNWIKRSGKRDRIVLATKAGADMGEGICVKKDYLIRACEGSLKRLQTDRIDLFQTHFDDGTTPVEETLAAYDTLIKQGKIRAIGASNLTPARLAASFAASKAQGLPRYESLQPNYSLVERKGFETDYAPLVRAEGIGVITYYSLAAGFLTGKYRNASDVDGAARGFKVKAYLNERGLGILKALDAVAAAHRATPAQVALAWLIARPEITAPIVSATTLTQLADIMKAATLTLTPAEIASLDQASA